MPFNPVFQQDWHMSGSFLTQWIGLIVTNGHKHPCTCKSIMATENETYTGTKQVQTAATTCRHVYKGFHSLFFPGLERKKICPSNRFLQNIAMRQTFSLVNSWLLTMHISCSIHEFSCVNEDFYGQPLSLLNLALLGSPLGWTFVSCGQDRSKVFQTIAWTTDT